MRETVSRETCAPEPGAHKRKYRCRKFEARRQEVRRVLLDAVISLASEGNFRADAGEIAARAGVDRRQIGRHFGSVALLCRVVARERPDEVIICLRGAGIDIAPLSARAAASLVWMVLVGTPKDLV